MFTQGKKSLPCALFSSPSTVETVWDYIFQLRFARHGTIQATLTTTRLHHRPASDLHRPGVDVGKGKGRCGASIQGAKDQVRDGVFALDIGHLQSIQAAIDRDVRPGILGKLVEVALVPRALCSEAGETGAVRVHLP